MTDTTTTFLLLPQFLDTADFRAHARNNRAFKVGIELINQPTGSVLRFTFYHIYEDTLVTNHLDISEVTLRELILLDLWAMIDAVESDSSADGVKFSRALSDGQELLVSRPMSLA